MSFLITLFLAFVFLTAVLNFVSAPSLESASPLPTDYTPKVSVLIVARNRARELHEHLPSLLCSDYPDFEVLVIDDMSNDGTATVVGQIMKRFPDRLRGYASSPPAAGWSRRAWSCQQIAAASQGEILIFADPTVSLTPTAIRKTVAFLHEQNTRAATVLPEQRMQTWIERAVVPFVTQLPYFGLFPLNRSRELGMDWTLTGEPSWFVINRAVYVEVGTHAQFKGSLLPELAIARSLREKRGEGPLPVMGAKDLSVRPWRSWDELRENLSATLPIRVGSRRWLAAILVFGVFSLPFFFLLIGRGWMTAVACILGFRLLNRAAFHGDWASVALHPVGAAIVAYLLVIRPRGTSKAVQPR